MKITDIFTSPNLYPFYVALAFVLPCSFLLIGSALFYVYIPDKPDKTLFKEITLTSNLDGFGRPVEKLSIFDPAVQRIYCFMRPIRTFGFQAGGVMQAKWYYRGQQVAGHYITLDPRYPIVIWLDPPHNKQFSQGDYRIDIFIANTLVETLYFKVQ